MTSRVYTDVSEVMLVALPWSRAADAKLKKEALRQLFLLSPAPQRDGHHGGLGGRSGPRCRAAVRDAGL